MAYSGNGYATTLDGFFKEKYASKLENLIPDGVKLLKMIPFSEKDKLGNFYNMPVIVGQEHGITFAAADDDLFNLNAPISGQTKNAQVRGTALVLRSGLGLQAASRAVASGAAFEDATKYLVANMLRSVTKKLEIEMLYGQVGYGSVASVSGNVITVTTADWAPGIWAGAENMPLEIRDSSNVVRGECSVSSVNLSSRTVTVDLLPAGTTGTDIIWHKGAYGNEFAGLHKILSNSSSELFGINASSYSLWAGNSYSASNAALSLAKIERAIALAVAKGLEADVVCIVNPKTWADMLASEAALRKYDSSYSSTKMENGARSIKFYGQNGMVTIEPSIYCREGYSYIFDPKDFDRIGSADVTFKRPGMEGQFFKDLENSAGVELRCYTDQALLPRAPGKAVIITNITNTA